MSAQAQEFWNNKYSNSAINKAPLEFVAQMASRLQKGKTLDLGMGEGANAVYLAQKGFTVKGFDLSTTAVERAQQLAKETGVTIETKVSDMDLFIMGLLEYDSIVMTYFKPSATRYYSEIIRSLKMGGTLLIESYMTQEQKEPMGHEDAYKNFYYGPNELLKNLAGLRILFYSESEINGKHVVQCLAQKPIDSDVAKYNLFDMGSGGQQKSQNTQRDLAEALFKKK